MGKKGYEDIYNEYVLEDEEYIEEIGELASRCIRRDFGISFSDEKDVSRDDIKIPIVTFHNFIQLFQNSKNIIA